MSEEEFICISYYDTKDLPIDIHCTKYRNIKYDIQEVLERTDDIDYVISDSRTTKNLLKENEQLKSQLQQKEVELEERKKEIIGQDKYIDKLKKEYDNQLQQKENIIKEVREILNNKRTIMTTQLLNGSYCNYEELLYQVDEEIRKILDKEKE